MYKALVFKELRDTAPIGCIAMLAYLACIVNMIGYPVFLGLIDSGTTGIPFESDQFEWFFSFVSICFVIGLGFWQTVAENNRGTWLFLLHRPASLRTIIGVKIIIGLLVYLLVSAAAILIYAAWAATPGTHASPFFWWMTMRVWFVWCFLVLFYLSAFLSGIRPGRWFGTRLLPLGGMVLLVFLWAYFISETSSLLAVVALFSMSGCIIFVINYIARIRDFS